MTYVSDQNQIPHEDLEKIRARLISQINSMNEAELKIVSRSEKDFRDFIADIFKSVAAALGYIVGVIVGTSEEILEGVKTGFKVGYRTGYDPNSGSPILGFIIIAVVTFILILIFKKWVIGYLFVFQNAPVVGKVGARTLIKTVFLMEIY